MSDYARAEKRQGYARLYLVVSENGHAAKCDRDGLLMAWTDWAQASKVAGICSGYVTNWETFTERFLPGLPVQPPAMRIFCTGKRGTRVFRAALDADIEELRTLNAFTPSDWQNRPLIIKRRLARAKVVQEDTP